MRHELQYLCGLNILSDLRTVLLLASKQYSLLNVHALRVWVLNLYITRIVLTVQEWFPIVGHSLCGMRKFVSQLHSNCMHRVHSGVDCHQWHLLRLQQYCVRRLGGLQRVFNSQQPHHSLQSQQLFCSLLIQFHIIQMHPLLCSICQLSTLHLCLPSTVPR